MKIRYTFLALGSSVPRSFLNEKGRLGLWPLHRQLRQFQVRQICELHAISWVLQRSLSPPQPTPEQCDTIWALYLCGDVAMAFSHDKITCSPGLLSQQRQDKKRQEKAWSVPDPFPREGMGSGDKTTQKWQRLYCAMQELVTLVRVVNIECSTSVQVWLCFWTNTAIFRNRKWKSKVRDKQTSRIYKVWLEVFPEAPNIYITFAT